MTTPDRARGPRRLLQGVFDGPPPALPAVLDAVSERWWRLRPRTRVAIAAAVALGVVAAGVGHVASTPWGAPVTVLVATSDLDIGHQVQPGDVRQMAWPSDLVPSGATAEAVGTVVAPVPSGSVITDRHVAGGGLSAAIPAGLVAVPLPADVLPGVPRGARLDLVAADIDAHGVVLTRDALVLADDGAHVWVAVDRAGAADVAAAAVGGRLTAVLVPR